MDDEAKAFFSKFETANTASDISAIGELYADAFMFGGPNGVQTVKKEDFLKVVPKMKSYFSSMGLSETRVETVETKPLDRKYLLAKVGWRMKLRSGSGEREVNTSATYILVRGGGDELSIVFQIDHQDLGTVVREEHPAVS